jgi:hypothetical protein
MEALELTDLKFSLKKALAENQISKVFKHLWTLIPPHNVGKVNTLFLLESDFNKLEELQIRGTHNLDVLSTKRAAFLENFMCFIDSLDVEDFAAPSEGTRRKTGSVLYGIPSKMAVGQQEECIVRLAFNESIIKEDLPLGKDVHIKAIRRIDRRMEVEFFDPNPEEVFVIRNVSTPVQTVEQNDYTEWLYLIKPLKEGVHELWLKVMVIIMEEGEKVKKDIVLQEKIEVLSEIEDSNLGLEMKSAGILLTIGLPSIAGGAEGPKPEETTSLASESVANLTGGMFNSVLFKIILPILLVSILVGGIYFLNRGNPESDEETTNNQEIPQDTNENNDRSSLFDFSLPTYEFLIEPQRDTLLELPSGSTFEIPANTVVNLNNTLISELVTIRIREIQKAHEILVSGISMWYPDSLQRDNWLQTAGMFDIQGSLNNQPTKIAEGKGITVNLISPVGGIYDFWQFISESESWINLGIPTKAEIISTADEKLRQSVADLIQLTSVRPSPPRKYESYAYLPNEIDISCCRELKPKDDDPFIYLSYAGSNPSEALENNGWVENDKWFWAKKTIRPSSLGKDIYEFQWRGDTIFTTYVRLDDGTKVSETSIEIYKKQKEEYDRNLDLLQQQQEVLDQQKVFQRNARIEGFGIYNFDKIWKDPDVISVGADFELESNNTAALPNMEVFLITGDRRVVVKYPKGWWHKFRFSPGSDNQLLAFLPNGQVGVFTNKDFKEVLPDIRKAVNEEKSYLFTLKIIDAEIRSLEDLSTLIESNSPEI